MKRLFSAAAAVALLAGCMSPNFTRLVPENKDADILIVYPYGQVVIRSRVNPQGSNSLPALSNTTPIGIQ